MAPVWRSRRQPAAGTAASTAAADSRAGRHSDQPVPRRRRMAPSSSRRPGVKNAWPTRTCRGKRAGRTVACQARAGYGEGRSGCRNRTAGTRAVWHARPGSPSAGVSRPSPAGRVRPSPKEASETCSPSCGSGEARRGERERERRDGVRAQSRARPSSSTGRARLPRVTRPSAWAGHHGAAASIRVPSASGTGRCSGNHESGWMPEKTPPKSKATSCAHRRARSAADPAWRCICSAWALVVGS